MPYHQRRRIPRGTRKAVWLAYCGPSFQGVCYCCRRIITYSSWHCGHVIADSRGGLPVLENLRPTCSRCNLSMGTHDMEAWILLQRSKPIPMELDWQPVAMEVT